MPGSAGGAGSSTVPPMSTADTDQANASAADQAGQKAGAVVQAEIEKKIESSKLSQAIDIHGYKLKEIPAAVWSIRGLRRLLLQNNLIEVVPEQIGVLTDLTVLYLQENRLSDLPAEVGLLTELNTLAAHCNRIRYLPREIGLCASLQVLTLNENCLVDTPIELGDCRRLKTIELKDNPDLAVPPPYIVQQGAQRIAEYFLLLGKVKISDKKGNVDFCLDLAKYRLRGFPIEITWMGEYLRVLILSNNIEIRSMPYDICRLTKLVVLRMEVVKLAGRLTQGLGYLTKLEELSIANNTIVSIPSSIGHATNLTVLNLDRNYSLELPPTDVQVKGYPNNFEFMKRLAQAEMHGGLDLKKFRLSHINFFKVAVCGHLLEHLPEPLENGRPWSHVISLDLTSNRLDRIQDIIGEFVNLKTLKCSGNRLSELPDVFTRLTRLEVLHLAQNAFQKFPEICCFADAGLVVEQKKGVGFDTSSLGVDEFEVLHVWSPGSPHPSLTDLDMSDNQLLNASKFLAKLTQLVQLNLSKNKVQKLPPDFRNLSLLARLDISNNEFQVFPNDVWACTKLEILRVAYNRISHIPSLIENLSLLQELDLSFNKVSDLPVQLGSLKNLAKPCFTGNTLNGIPNSLAKGGDSAIMAFWRAMVESKKTKKFDVSNTGMVDLPTQIEHMTWLSDLNLSDNGLLRLPAQIQTLALVEHLNVARNRLSALPKEIGNMRMLRSLDITGNKIRVLPLELGFCQDLRELHFDEQMIVMPTKEVLALGIRSMTVYLRRLKEAIVKSRLALTGMTLSQVPKEVYDMIDLKELIVDKNSIFEIEAAILNFDVLEVLSANLNDVENLNFLLGDPRKPPWDKQRLGELNALMLRGNKIDVLPAEISRLKSLAVLLMDNNRLKELPDEIGMLLHLQQLSFTRNELSAVPNTMSNLIQLNVFMCSHNQIVALPCALGKLMELTKFEFNENPLLEPPLEIVVKGSDFVLNYLDNCCKAFQDGSLEVSSVGLYEIPREICRITSLTKLNLSDNKIQLIRNDLIALENLEIIDLSENNLKIFPQVLCSLSLLMDLNIGHNKIARLPVQLGRLTNLKKLGLDGLKLIQPAAEISNLSAPNIVEYMRKFFRVDKGESRKLEISGVGFNKFPREIATLGTALTELSLQANAIQDLTDEIGQLKALQYFTAAKNRLLTLPYELNMLKEVVSLDFSENFITQFPNVHALRKLEYLDVSFNGMTSLPLKMRNWKSLRTLKANNNDLKSLPEPLGELEYLVLIDVSFNQLKSLPGSMKHLSRLRQLHVKNNDLTKVPAVVPLLTSLEHLSLSNDVNAKNSAYLNRILALPPALCLCTAIKVLDVSYSYLIAPPAETHEGGINSVFSYLGALYLAQYDKILHLTHWNLQAFPLDGNFLTSLTVMNLQHNQIRTLPPTVGYYAHLVNLNLMHNKLETLPERIEAMHAGLTELNVSYNELLKLPNGLFRLTSLIRLRLSHNKIKVIPDNVSKLTMLRHLDLDFNQVQVLPETLASMSRLTDLFLEDCPIKIIGPSTFTNCRSMRNLKVQVEWLDDMIAWRKDLSTYKLISGHGVKFPPTEVLMHGSDAIWKYLLVCANSKTTKVLELSRVTFWMIEMEISNQRFYTWPEDLCRYEHLERLNLAGNFLMTVHPTVSCLTNLVELDLESNRLRSLPVELACCTALERIMLLRNPDLASPSREVTTKGSANTIAFLQCLHLAQNQDRAILENGSYRRVPIEILHLNNAVEMSLSRNTIEFLPAEVGNLTNLKRLKMSQNKLVFLPDELCQLTKLQYLEIADNNLCAFPDDLPLLSNLTTLEADGNFTGNIPPELRKVGGWLCIEYVTEIKRGRTTGHVNLRGFELLTIPLDIVFIDRPPRFRKTFVDGYVRAYAEEMNKLRKRQLEEIKAEELRKIREAMGLDPDHVSEFSDTDAKFNATEEFCDDAVIHLAPVQVVRRRDRMRTFDQFCDSFNGWYACAIGYNTVEEMKKNASNDDDVKKIPSDIELYDFLVRRFGPPEIDEPCRDCIEKGKECLEIGSGSGLYRRHKGMHAAVRVGWYNVKLRQSHGQEAQWSDEVCGVALFCLFTSMRFIFKADLP